MLCFVIAMELQLVSASSAGGEPADCTLVYRLDEENSDHSLPVVYETHPWAGKTVGALRDRLMIEWVMSFPESKRLFRSMVDEINSAIQRRNSSGSRSGASKLKIKPTVLRVGVVCRNGAQLSPSFVEKLYKHFSCGAVVVEGLRVSRHHWDALKGDWGHSKNILWQVSCVPVHDRVTVHFDQVFDSKMWLNFDPTDNDMSEKQFQKDPFNSSVNFTDMVLDFESGTAYSSGRRKTYYIRCSTVSQSKANCWFLTSNGYKSACRSFRAAGIQPYSIHPVTGEAIFLLGRITYGTEDWCDFGGLKSSRLGGERPRFTAARECYEETLGILGNTKELAAALKDFKTNNCFKVLNVDTSYVAHYMRIPYRDYPGIFEKVLKGDEYRYKIEVDEMKWFSLSSLKSAVIVAHSEQYGITQHSITAKALQEDGTVDDSCSHCLRTPYVGSLCIADSLNILNSIAAIARRVHREHKSSDSAMPREVPSDPDDQEKMFEGDPKKDHASSVANTHTAKDITVTACEEPQLQNVDEKGLTPLASQLEAVSQAKALSGPPSPVTHGACEQFSAQISSNESDSETESDDAESDDTLGEDGVLDSGHLGQTSRSCASKEATVTPEVGETGKEPSSREDGGDGCELNDRVSMFSNVKSKLFSGRTGPKKRRTKKSSRQRTGHKQLSSKKGTSSKPSRKNSKQLLLFGMGAGTFTVIEGYMNS